MWENAFLLVECKDLPKPHNKILLPKKQKESARNTGDLGLIPGSGRSPEKEMATHSSILA